MVTAVWERIPKGTSLGEARKQMDAAGFTREVVDKASFSEATGTIGDDGTHRSVNDARFLSCERTESAGFLVAHIWRIAIVVDKADKVDDVLVLHRMDGP
jgi:hypothetical protein